MTRNNIPSDADFAKASAAIKYRSRGLSQIRDKILARFRGKGGLYEFFIMDCSEKVFRVLVFYRWERQIEQSEKSGFAATLRDAVLDELERFGRGRRSEIQVEFEFDSHETVERNYDGNYYNRLH